MSTVVPLAWVIHLVAVALEFFALCCRCCIMKMVALDALESAMVVVVPVLWWCSVC